MKRPTAPVRAAAPGPARDSLERLLEILQDEGRALACGDLDGLGRSVREKESVLQRLAIEAGRVDGATLRQMIRRARDQNDRNARLLAPRLNLNRARLESLFGATSAGALYQADGRAPQTQQVSPQRGVRA